MRRLRDGLSLLRHATAAAPATTCGSSYPATAAGCSSALACGVLAPATGVCPGAAVQGYRTAWRGPARQAGTASFSSSSSSSHAAHAAAAGEPLPDVKQQQDQQQQRPSTAAESAAATYQAQLQVLQGLGLGPAAAAALHKAWVAGTLRKLPSMNSLLFAAARPSAVAAESPARLLVQLRRLLRAHAAAAAAAEESGGQQSLHWGMLDLGALLVNAPDLALVPPEVLSARVDALLAGLEPLLGAEHSLAFLHNSAIIRLQLDDPAAAVAKVQAMHDAYVDVLGAPPRTLLLANTQSSYTRVALPTFTGKLAYFRQKWGRDVAHSLLSRQPHLLSSAGSSLAYTSDQLQHLLGCDDEEMGRVLTRAPRLLNSDFSHTRDRLLELTSQLGAIGLEPEDVRALVLKMPLLMLLNPISTATKLAYLKNLLGPAGHRLRLCVMQEPTLLASSADTLRDRLATLQEVLACDRDRACRIVAAAPVVLSLAPDTLTRKIAALTEVLHASTSEVQAMCGRLPALLMYRPEYVHSKLVTWAATLGQDMGQVVAAVRVNLGVLSYEASVVAAHIIMLRKLVARSSLWSAGRSGLEGSTPATPAAVTAAAALPCAASAGEQQAGAGAPRHGRASAHAGEAAKGCGGSSTAQRRRGRPPRNTAGWEFRCSRCLSGRILLRLEYLLATGQHETVTLAATNSMSEAAWTAAFPDYHSWAQLRVQHLRRDPSDWPRMLVERAAQTLTPARRRAIEAASAGRRRSRAVAAQEAAAAAAAHQQLEGG